MWTLWEMLLRLVARRMRFGTARHKALWIDVRLHVIKVEGLRRV